jgi:hypothetical protein
MTTAYEMLGVDANADEATIRAAFRRAAKSCHPDLNGGDSSGEHRLRHLIAAREMLIKPRWRRPQNGDEFPRLSSSGEKWGVIAAATVAGAITLLLLVYMSQQWNTRLGSFETAAYPESIV